jgi:hypothetical protein
VQVPVGATLFPPAGSPSLMEQMPLVVKDEGSGEQVWSNALTRPRTTTDGGVHR